LLWAGSPLVAADGTILVPANGELGLTALDANGLGALGPGGRVLWTLPGTASGGAADLALGADGTLYVFAGSEFGAFRSDGGTAWTHPIAANTPCGPPASVWGLTVGPDGTIYLTWHEPCGPEPSAMAAFAPDGTPKWNLKLDSDAPQSAPTMGADGNVYFLSWSESASSRVYLEAVSPGGSIVWKLGPLQGASGAYPSGVAVASDGTVYASAGAAVLAATPGGKSKWALALPTGMSVPAVGPDGEVYVVEYSGILDAVSPAGKVAWSYDSGASTAGILGPPLVGGDGTVYFGGRVPTDYYSSDTSQYTLAVSPPGHLLWRAPIGAPRALGGDGSLVAVDDGKNSVTVVTP
jgi:hypothetical protein